MKYLNWILILSAVAGLSLFRIASAQSYPTRSVRMLVPTGAGGPLDTVSRGLAQSLSQVFGQSFVVENRTGADGIIALEACAKSAPDALTLCSIDSWPITLNPILHPKLPYDPDRDFAPVIHYGTLGSALCVHPSVPANSLRELFELAKAKPDSIVFATYGLASNTFFYVEWLKKVKGIPFMGVPYKSTSQAIQAVLAGEAQVFAYGLGQSIGLAKAGKLKILAVAGDERSPALPDTPSFKESGMELSMRTWFGMFVPAATPKGIVQKLNAEIARILRTPEFKDKFLTRQGVETNPPSGESTEAFAKFVKQDREMYANLLKTVGVKAE